MQEGDNPHDPTFEITVLKVYHRVLLQSKSDAIRSKFTSGWSNFPFPTIPHELTPFNMFPPAT